MKVSVIVTTYNRPDALEKVIRGLLCQTRMPDEILIADDGSTSQTRRMLMPYLKHSQVRIVHVWQEDKGFRAARIRNLAVSRATGEYLISLDGDCIPQKHFVADHLDLAKPGCFFQGKRVLVEKKAEKRFDHTDANSGLSLFKNTLRSNLSNCHHILRLAFFPSWTTNKMSGVRSCNMGFFMEDLKAVNGFNHEFVGWGREDSELVARLYKYGLKRRENPFRAICYHLWHNENDRTGLEENDRLLTRVEMADDYFCKSGLDEFLNKEEL